MIREEKPQLVAFGEPLMRLSVPRGTVFSQASSFGAYIGGSELNVAIGASSLGIKSRLVAKVPANGPGQLVLRAVLSAGVDATYIIASEDGRLGLYYHEYGTPQRPASVIYDRFPSAFQSIGPDEVNWREVLKGASLFHTSGITAALGEGPLETLKEGIRVARELGLKVSFDINYRSRLWSPKEAAEVLKPLLPQVEILFTSLGDIETVLGIATDDPARAYREVADTYDIQVIAGVYGDPEFRQAPWVAMALCEGELLVDRREFTIETVDRIGAGDAFAAGFLKGYLQGDPESGLAFGTAMMALKNSVRGDYYLASPGDMESFLSGSGAMVRR